MSFELVKKAIIHDIGETDRSNALLEFLDNKKFGVRQIGHDSYNFTLAGSDAFIREEDTFTSDYDNEQLILHLIIPDKKSRSGTFFMYDDISEDTMDMLVSYLWGARGDKLVQSLKAKQKLR